MRSFHLSSIPISSSARRRWRSRHIAALRSYKGPLADVVPVSVLDVLAGFLPVRVAYASLIA